MNVSICGQWLDYVQGLTDQRVWLIDSGSTPADLHLFLPKLETISELISLSPRPAEPNNPRDSIKGTRGKIYVDFGHACRAWICLAETQHPLFRCPSFLLRTESRKRGQERQCVLALGHRKKTTLPPVQAPMRWLAVVVCWPHPRVSAQYHLLAEATFRARAVREIHRSVPHCSISKVV